MDNLRFARVYAVDDSEAVIHINNQIRIFISELMQVCHQDSEGINRFK